MNYLVHLFIVVFLFTASIVCQESNATTHAEPIENATVITTTTVEPPNATEPQNTTIVPPTTTESPIGNWTVLNENGTICIMVVMNAEFHIVYNTKDNTTNVTQMSLDPHATVSDKSSCHEGLLVLEFGKRDNLTFHFAKDEKSVWLANITLGITLDSKMFPNATARDAQYTSDTKLFETSTGKSYLCKTETEVALSAGSKMELKDLQVEAFRTKEESGFSEATECTTDGDVSDIVPIAVGCALAGLVVIVLIAYLVGRRHKRQKGYESV